MSGRRVAEGYLIAGAGLSPAVRSDIIGTGVTSSRTLQGLPAVRLGR